MKNTELRIGNLVSRNNDIYKIWDLKRTELELDNEILDRHVGYCRYDEIKPIKITKEWLLKLGFKVCNMDGIYIYTSDYDKIEFNSMLICWVSNTKRNLKYVHQVQNLYFALTARELTVA